MTKDVEASLGLGGNVGDVVGKFVFALTCLENCENVRVLRASSVYRTPPWGKLDQPDFLNMALVIATTLEPRALLDLCLSVEQQAGRIRADRWGPRTLDIDILTYGERTIDEPGLGIPHPRIAERAFVLTPLAEIAPDLMLGGASVASLAAQADAQGIARDDAATRRLMDQQPINRALI